MLGVVLNTTAARIINHMPLSLNNNLSSTVFRFSSTHSNEILFSCHLDICAVMKTGSLLLHMWIIIPYPDIVFSYEQYDDANQFQQITLDCAIPASEADKDSGKMPADVTLKTRYCDKDS